MLRRGSKDSPPPPCHVAPRDKPSIDQMLASTPSPPITPPDAGPAPAAEQSTSPPQAEKQAQPETRASISETRASISETRSSISKRFLRAGSSGAGNTSEGGSHTSFVQAVAEWGEKSPFRAVCNVKRASDTLVRLRATMAHHNASSVMDHDRNVDRVLGFKVPRDYRETQARDQVRRKLLNDARTHGSIDTVLRVDKVHQTVLARLPRHPVTYLVLGTYAVSAGLTYTGRLTPTETPDYYDDFGILVVFMIVFYFGYCYDRFELMFGQVKQGIRSVFNCCLMARTTFKDKEALFHLWRYLNLLHAAAYVSLTPTYKKENLFDSFVEQHALLLDPKVQSRFQDLAHRSFRSKKKRASFAVHREATANLELSVADALATNSMWTACMVWALEVIDHRYKCGDFSAPIHQQMTSLIVSLSDALYELELVEFQVLPYIYTHLVSLSCMIYLVVSAFIKGAQCEVDGPITTTIILPAFAVLLQTITVIGLLEIGNVMANPLSPAKEAFAICHLVNFTCANSLSVVSIDGAPTVGGTEEESKRVNAASERKSKGEKRERRASSFEGVDMPVMNASDPDSASDEENSPEIRQLLAIQTKQLQAQQRERELEADGKKTFYASCRSLSESPGALRRCVANGFETLASLPGVVRKGGQDPSPGGGSPTTMRRPSRCLPRMASDLSIKSNKSNKSNKSTGRGKSPKSRTATPPEGPYSEPTNPVKRILQRMCSRDLDLHANLHAHGHQLNRMSSTNSMSSTRRSSGAGRARVVPDAQ